MDAMTFSLGKCHAHRHPAVPVNGADKACLVTRKTSGCGCQSRALPQPRPVPLYLHLHLCRRGAAQGVAGIQATAQAEHVVDVFFDRRVEAL